MGRLIDADAFSAFIKDAVIKYKYDRLNIDNTLTVADVLQSVCAELDGTGLEGFKNSPTVDAVPVVRCRDCMNWIPGYITDTDEMIPPKCGKYQQMVGHSSDDFCSLGERKDGEQA